MGNKQNPFLAAFEAKLRAQYQMDADRREELDRIAFMKTVHEELGVGPGRADRVFNAFQVNRIEIAEKILEDYGQDKHTGDKEILHTKASYAKLLRRIFRPEDWQEVKIWFPLLKEYWEG